MSQQVALAGGTLRLNPFLLTIISLDVLGYPSSMDEKAPDKPEQKEPIMPDLTEVSEGETALRAVERDWNAAGQHWNSAGLVALYTEDAPFFWRASRTCCGPRESA
jgi:hypothetical protein